MPQRRLNAGLWTCCALAFGVALARPAGAEEGSDGGVAAFRVFAAHCFECHNPVKHESDLNLQTRESLLKGGERGAAITPGDPEQSLLYFFVTRRAKPNMPPKPKAPLEEADLRTIENWIKQGAPWPANAEELLKEEEHRRAEESIKGRPFTEEDRCFWSFQPPKAIAPPDVPGRTLKNEIDKFLAVKLREKGLEPSPPATRWELIRRATLDLTGIPPTESETLAFVFDRSPDAFEKVIDRLLASPRYGERWGRHWLDVARYADSNGYEFDYHRPDAWRFRDYVINAFNSDKPYDRFVLEQLAGDELPDKTTETLIASGFNRLGPTVDNQESEEARMNELDDMVSTTSSAFLGMTVGCARCHDHKFDPIPQADYYRIQAVFYPTRKTELPLVPDEDWNRNRAAKEAIDKDLDPLRRAIEAIEVPYRAEMMKRTIETFPEAIRTAYAVPADQRTEGQRLIVKQAMDTIHIHYKASDLEALYTPEHKEAIEGLRKLMARLESRRPGQLPIAMGLRDVSATPASAHLLIRGVAGNKGPEVGPGALSILATAHPFNSNIAPSDKSTLRRTALARWITSPENPLTARVMVNRIWQHHFGRGIVATPGDFGRTGERPTHPELLDYLALEFIRRGWSVKSMHRLIMTSAAYQQSSANDPKRAEIDGDNLLFWRQNPRRLEAESLRDSELAVGGKLNPKMGGPAFVPPVSEEMKISVGAAVEVKPTDDPVELSRRSVYMYLKRNLPPPMLEVMDLPDSNITCPRRDQTTVPTQALTLFNNAFTIDQARNLASLVCAESPSDPEALVKAAYWRALSRPPREAEMKLACGFLDEGIKKAKSDADCTQEKAVQTAMSDLCRVILNTSEFVYIR